jgi:hypothetical protein
MGPCKGVRLVVVQSLIHMLHPQRFRRITQCRVSYLVVLHFDLVF